MFTYRSVAPAGGPDNSVVTDVIAAAGNASGLHVIAIGDDWDGAHHGKVIVRGPRVIAMVKDDALDTVDNTAAVGVARTDAYSPSVRTVAPAETME